MPTHDEINSLGWMRGDQLATLEDARDWANWRIYPRTLVLVHIGDDGFEDYEVDVEECLTSAQVLDWICQVAGKGWADDAAVAGLVRAVHDVLRPQANLCSLGRSSTITKRQVAELVNAAARRRPDLVHVRSEDES